MPSQLLHHIREWSVIEFQDTGFPAQEVQVKNCFLIDSALVILSLLIFLQDFGLPSFSFWVKGNLSIPDI